MLDAIKAAIQKRRAELALQEARLKFDSLWKEALLHDFSPVAHSEKDAVREHLNSLNSGSSSPFEKPQADTSCVLGANRVVSPSGDVISLPTSPFALSPEQATASLRYNRGYGSHLQAALIRRYYGEYTFAVDFCKAR